MKLNIKQLIHVSQAVLITMVVHEAGHWLTGLLLGNRMAMSLNFSFPVNGYYLADWHYAVVVAAGPAATLLQSIISLFILWLRNNIKDASEYLFVPVIYRVFPYLVSSAGMQDEVIVSRGFGLPGVVGPVFIWILLLTIAFFGVKSANKILLNIQLTKAKFSLLAFGLFVILDKFIILPLVRALIK